MKILIAKIITIGLIVGLCSLVQAENPPTNEQFTLNAVENSALLLLDSLGLKDSQAFIENKTGLDGLVADGFIAALFKRNIVLVNTPDHLSKSGLNIKLGLSAFDFKYISGKSRGFFKKNYIKRQATGQMQLSIVGKDCYFLGFRDFSATDEIEPAYANYVASIRYNQLSPDAPSGSAMKYVEPLAIAATVGGLMYLFFINR